MMDFETAFRACPLVAILRGVTPGEIEGIGAGLVDAGFTLIEVPMNSPKPCESIARLSRLVGDRAVVGAGTVLSVEAVEAVEAAGGRLIVMPHGDTAVIRAAKARGMACTPGVTTPTEAFAALGAGADGLKLFPAEMIPPKVVKAIRAVLPPEISLLPVGGIAPETMGEYFAAGANGFGLGSALYKPGRSAEDVAARARAFIAALPG